jgi:type I restriction enzyme S subunit
MAGEWSAMPLGDAIELKRGYDLPSRDRRDGPVPIVSSSGISGCHIDARAKGPGVVIGRYGTLGKVHYLNQAYWPLNTTLYVRDFKGNDPRFVSYLLRSLDFSAYSDKAAVPGLNRNDLHTKEVSLAPLWAQRAIAHILGTLDDKIELNRRRNQTLEAMARALFKDWFVDFGPVRAKMEGRWKPGQSIPGLPTHIYDLFPDQLVESELGEIPEGWRYQTLAQLTDKVGSGATPRGGSKVYIDEGVALIRSQNVYDSLFVWDGLVRISDEAAEQLKGVTVQQEDVLLNITGASILRTCIVEASVLPARVNQHVAIIRTKPGVPPRFVHMHLLRPDIKNYMLGLNAGASREAITKGHIESLPLLTPSSELLEAFRSETDPLFQRGKCISQEIRWLGELRDTLLPKLLSGELRIKDAKRFMEGARV